MDFVTWLLGWLLLFAAAALIFSAGEWAVGLSFGLIGYSFIKVFSYQDVGNR